MSDALVPSRPALAYCRLIGWLRCRSVPRPQLPLHQGRVMRQTLLGDPVAAQPFGPPACLTCDAPAGGPDGARWFPLVRCGSVAVPPSSSGRDVAGRRRGPGAASRHGRGRKQKLLAEKQPGKAARVVRAGGRPRHWTRPDSLSIPVRLTS